ncbi:LMBR1-like conserved region-containing protein [Trypanosoma theileri]|uniref:LMBR1-like conserved region-containing protein n=1 Tax=Trypanosoma theileri TaxID=67003 RepID=A0A1X0NKT2_9TRYP|nr:LMBR1-like conserved region-containing protein [Trypanosoma theileri]ORC84720.1 LMBR1-like conserved region-containing protein [Trypanosoma theileri]
MVYYESMEPEHRTFWQQVKWSVIVTTIIVVVFVILFFLCWGTSGYASIAYAEYQVLGNPASSFSTVTEFSVTSRNATLRFRVSLFTYFVALTCVIGWILFFLFGGVGLAAMPIDYIMFFYNRPKPITAAEYALRRAEIAQESQRLMENGKKIEEEEHIGHLGRRHREKVLAFKQQVRELESYHSKVETSYREKGGEVIKGYLYLFLGIVFASMSFMWLLQMIIHNMAHAHPFLNNMFRGLDKAFMFFGVLAYGCFSFYLLWCVVKGCIKIGGNLVLFQIYPMEPNGTFMNAFLFNAMLIMITSMSVVQFCTVSFAEYAANTNISAMFTVYVANMQGIKYVVMYLQYPLLVIACLSIAWLLICPRRRVNDD